MKTPLIVLLLSGTLVAGGAGAVVIDGFESGNFDFTITGPAPPSVTDSRTNTGLNPSQTLGGSRYVEGVLLTANAGVDDEVRIRRLGAVGALDISNTAGADSQVSVRWDANGAGLGGVDITEGDNSYFFLSFPEPIGNQQMAVTLTIDTTGGQRSRTVAIPYLSTTFSIPFADFSGTGSFTSVNRILMLLEGEVQWDARLSLIETRGAPLPGTLALVGIGLAALAGRRRRT